MKIVIMAGGTGTRLWPMSRNHKPKQFFPVFSENPMVYDTYLRFVEFFDPQKIYISTTQSFVDEIKKIFPSFSLKNIIVEPEKRDTAPAMGYVAARMYLDNPKEPIVFVPSDHFIADNQRFIQSILYAEELINQTGKLLDIGVVPNFPSTVLGYTHIEEKFCEKNNIVIYKFGGHKEKPPYSLAQEYVKSGEYLWHASYYMWTPELFLSAYKKYAPDLFISLCKIMDVLKNSSSVHDEQMISTLYNKMEKISFDYAITEKIQKDDVLIIRGDFGWSDIGACDVLYDKISVNTSMISSNIEEKKYYPTNEDHISLDANKNVLKGKVIALDTANSIIYSSKGKIIATLGLSDMVIIDTPDALLICPKGKSQQVKDIVSILKENELDSFL